MPALVTGLAGIVADLTTVAEVVGALCLSGAGFFYMTARGNPRGQENAWQWITSIGKGLLLNGGAMGISSWLAGRLTFS